MAGRKIHIFQRKTLRAAAGELQRRASRLREITMVVRKYAIFVEDFRVPEDPGGEVRADASRVSPNRSSGVRVLKLSSTPFGSGRPFGRLTAEPRRISLGFAHSAAAAGR